MRNACRDGCPQNQNVKLLGKIALFLDKNLQNSAVLNFIHIYSNSHQTSIPDKRLKCFSWSKILLGKFQVLTLFLMGSGQPLSSMVGWGSISGYTMRKTRKIQKNPIQFNMNLQVCLSSISHYRRFSGFVAIFGIYKGIFPIWSDKIVIIFTG